MLVSLYNFLCITIVVATKPLRDSFNITRYAATCPTLRTDYIALTAAALQHTAG
jgi:hypothetical protein